MTTQPEIEAPETSPASPPNRRVLIVAACVILVVIAAIAYFSRGGASDAGTDGTAFKVRKGPLRISVIEGGSVEALESQTIKCEVQGETKILTIVEEGYLVTEKDVEDGKILVTLDSSDLLERQTQQEIEYQSAAANYTDAKEQYEIQVKQNESDIKSAELEVKFARMDFEKYLGAEVASEILTKLNLDKLPEAEAELTDSVLPADDEQPADSSTPEDETAPVMPVSSRPDVDFSQYAKLELLGDGEAQEQLRNLRSDRMVAEEEMALAETTRDGTRRLAEKKFVTQQELDQDEMKVLRSKNAAEAARIAEDLFIRYEFPKQAEKLLTDYEEAIRKLERTRKQAISKIAQAEAKLRSNQAQYELQSQRRREIQEQIEKCEIPAERPGLVLYATMDRYRSSEPIGEGVTVRYSQDIITIPDMTEMAVNVKIHESSIKKVEKGQKAEVRLDAFPDQQLTGEVVKVSVVPDSGSRWMNPDIKLYPTKVSIDGVYDWLKPGMSAEVEIIIDDIKDTLYVPLQAVNATNGDKVCYVRNGGEPERRIVETGQFNNEYIQILSGLKAGEQVLLRPPQGRAPAGPAPAGPAPQTDGPDRRERGRSEEQRRPAGHDG